MSKTITCFLLLFGLVGCSNKTFIPNELKKINPYQEGQKITFISQDGKVSTLEVRKVEGGQFPEGLGQFRNERLKVVVYRKSMTSESGKETRILTLLAKDLNYPDRIHFSISLKEAYLQMEGISLTKFNSLDEIELDTRYHHYDDVVFVESPPKVRIYDNEIKEFYWSKSKGYVRLVQNNGVVWDLQSSNVGSY